MAAEWEQVSEVVLDAEEPLDVCSSEYAPSDPPSGEVVGLGRHHLRLHARGEAKVQDDAYVATPLEEHLVLVWPADAPARPAGEGPRWGEVTGVPAGPLPDGMPRSGYGAVKVPDGRFELRWRGAVPASVPDSDGPALVAADGVLTVAVGRRGMTDVSVEIAEHSPEDHDWYADAVLQAEIKAEGPLRLLDGTGQSPRGMLDPLTTRPGHWGVRLYARHREPDYGQIMLIWPWGAPTKEEADRAEYGELDYLDEDESVEAEVGEIFIVELAEGEPTDLDLARRRYLAQLAALELPVDPDEPDGY